MVETCNILTLRTNQSTFTKSPQSFYANELENAIKKTLGASVITVQCTLHEKIFKKGFKVSKL